jgi:hypothetical protein
LRGAGLCGSVAVLWHARTGWRRDVSRNFFGCHPFGMDFIRTK